MDRLRMHERDLETEHAAPRAGVDQLDALLGQTRECRLDVVDRIRDVMHARASLREELTDGRVLAERCEQLDATVAETYRRCLDALLLDPLAMLEAAAE